MTKSNLDTDSILTRSLRAFESDELPLPFCDSAWHTKRHGDDDFCPDCLSEWWATDGSEPTDPALYWLRIIARERAAALDEEQKTVEDDA